MAIMLFFPMMTGLSIVREHAGPGVDLGWALPFLIPQALPIAIPAGLLCGGLFGIGARPVATLVRRTVVLIAILGSLFSFAMLDFVVPNANQAFRTAVFQRSGNSRPPARGLNELTLRELRLRLIAMNPPGALHEMRMLRLSYHERIALSLTPLVFGLLGLGLVGRIRKQRIVISLTAVTLFSSYFVLYPFYGLMGDGAISPVLVAWTPNAVALLLTMACSAHARRHRESAV
jgi:lipopolysaccharide export LptBFGC system permease protein LptF